ncbi:hypothetical protein ABL78_1283 [Leptomonas seymouri]|uniref:Uncharacterized protein n=1 Tax=Leptomonas seymouri TaxID=5684 RepID=A0A0N1I2G7_LEPSE|nr:hypothetical protein ABL78_1283 [Leptomonas seymouri]|eukprot:KPI89618.1 hypothetical protein ABL78_1283 [Leptomonas seymouri]
MAGENRDSRSSFLHTASIGPSSLQPGILFAEPPVALPNLDELRATDVLIRAYYISHPKAPLPANPPLIGLVQTAGATPLNADTAERPLHTSPHSSASPATVVTEAKIVGEVIGAALARDVVEAAAKLYTARRSDDLAETYTACATWDDARDVVAGAFLPQDLRGSGLSSEAATENSELPRRDTQQKKQQLEASVQTPPTPVFMRSALSLAGVATRTPTCTLTPQSSLYPPRFGTSLPVRRASHVPTGPIPPAGIPMDAFSRYVTVMEDASVPSAAAVRSCLQLRTPQPRPRATKRKAKAAKAATPTAASPALSPSPPLTSNPPGKRGVRGSSGRSQQESPEPEQTPIHGKVAFRSPAQPPPEDPLTRALRQGLLVSVGDGTQGAAKAERSPGRPSAVGMGLTSSSFLSMLGGNDGAKKAAGKQFPRGGGGVIAVEQDRLLSTDRGGKSVPRARQRKDGVQCRVLPSDESETSSPPQGDEMPLVDESSANNAALEEDKANKRGSRRLPQSNAAKNAAGAKAAKDLAAEREAWTTSFFTATDTAGETSLQEQVQVIPSPGVTVVGGAPLPIAAQTARRGHKSSSAGASTALYGGEFTVPADRLALSAFDEKRAAVRKPNVPGYAASSGRARPAQVFKTM